MERNFPPRTRAKLIKAFPEYHRQKKKTKETLMKQRLNAGNKSWEEEGRGDTPHNVVNKEKTKP